MGKRYGPQEIQSIQVIAANVRQVRHAHGMSQEELAELLDVSVPQIQKYESASNRISAAKLHRMARFLNVPIERFFAGL